MDMIFVSESDDEEIGGMTIIPDSDDEKDPKLIVGEVKHLKCPKCKSHSPDKDFLNLNGRRLKSCVKCRIRGMEYRNRRKCVHGRHKYQCIDCGGSQTCVHKRRKSDCKECKGSQVCIHNKLKPQCKECNGTQICVHKRLRATCKECEGSQVCVHGRLKSSCVPCGGSKVCIHKRMRSQCKDCNFNGFLLNRVSIRISTILRDYDVDRKSTVSLLGCSIEDYKTYIEDKLKPSWNWDNYGVVWNIDHIIPLSYQDPTLKEVLERFHYKNTQPMCVSENSEKGNRYIG